MVNTVILRRPVLRHSKNFLALAFTLFTLSSTPSWAQAPKASGPVSLQGAGSTFAAPLYKKWIEEYGVAHRNVSISYDVVGSGEGVKRFITKAVDFAGSDEILTESESAQRRRWSRSLPE